MSDPPPAQQPRPARFYELIEEAVAEYERVSALVQAQRPVELEDVEAKPLELEPSSEKALPRLRQHSSGSLEIQMESSSHSATASKEPGLPMGLPGQLHQGDVIEEPCLSREGSCISASSDLSLEDRKAVIAKLWERMVVEYMGLEGTTLLFTIRKCWSTDDSDSGRLTKMMSRPTLVQHDPVQRLWHEKMVHGRAAVRTSRIADIARAFKGEHAASTLWMMHPCSTWRLLWVLMGLFFLAVDATLMSMFMFEIARDATFEAIDGTYWAIDVLLTFRTGIYRKVGGLDMDHRSVARTYIRTWFGLDLCLLVIQWVLWFDDTVNVVSSAGFIRWMRVVRCVKLLRLAKLDRLMSIVLERIQSLMVHLIIEIAIYMFCVVVWIHISACAWYWVGQADGGWVQVFKRQHDYLVSAHWAATQLQGNSNDDPGVSSVAYAFALVQVLASIVVLAGFIGRLTTVMQTLEKSAEKRKRVMKSAWAYSTSHQISMDLFVRVRRYIERQENVEAHQLHNQNELELLQVLPKNLSRELLLEARAPLMNQHVFFMSLDRFYSKFYERLCCEVLHAVAFLPGESIYTQGVVAKHAYFIAVGDTSLFTYGLVFEALQARRVRSSTVSRIPQLLERQKELKTEVLKEGTAVCEAALWVRWVHAGDFDAVSQASLLNIEVSTFEELVKAHVSVQRAMAEHAHRMAKALNNIDALSDLFTSLTALQKEAETANPHLRRASTMSCASNLASAYGSFTPQHGEQLTGVVP